MSLLLFSRSSSSSYFFILGESDPDDSVSSISSSFTNNWRLGESGLVVCLVRLHLKAVALKDLAIDPNPPQKRIYATLNARTVSPIMSKVKLKPSESFMIPEAVGPKI